MASREKDAKEQSPKDGSWSEEGKCVAGGDRVEGLVVLEVPEGGGNPDFPARFPVGQ
jgi:hypothetical protein